MKRFQVMLALALGACRETSPPSVAPSAAASAGAVPSKVVIRANPNADGTVAISLDNRGSAPAELAWSFGIERLSSPADDSDLSQLLSLVTSCSDAGTSEAGPKCRTLAAGESLTLVPWTGRVAAPQCPRPTPSDYALAAGPYRISLASCDGQSRYRSLPFQKLANPE